MRSAALAAIFLLSACGADDSGYPMSMTGLDAWVQDNDSGKQFYAGRVEANYLGRTDAASKCRDLAIGTARANNLQRWGYVCCTVTSSSDCVTKIR